MPRNPHYGRRMDQVDQHFAFHRLARSWPQYRWWKPLITALLGIAFYVVFTVVLLVIGAIIAFATSADMQRFADMAVVIDLSNPVILAVTLLSLILMIPALALAELIVGPRPIGLLSSVAGRIRWRWMAVCVAAALAVFLASLLVSTIISFFFPEEGAPAPVQQDTSILLIMLALSILAVPFQAAAEEYVFRGFLMQAIGSWLRHPAFAILLPVPLFVLGHGYDPLGQTDVAIFAIFAGWISWRTGGLEAAIAVHAINNMTIFVLGAFGLVDVNSTEGSVSGLVVSVATMAVTAVVIVRLANRRGIDRTRAVSPGPIPAYPFPPHAMPAGGPPPFGIPSPVPSAQGPWGPVAIQPPPQAPVASWPGAYDPSQYDTSRYDPGDSRQASVASPALHTRPPVDPATDPPSQSPFARPVTPPDTPTPPDTLSSDRLAGDSLPMGPGPATPPPAPVAIPASTPAPAGDYGADRHPSGPAHPPGPGYPAGIPHPPGPGYPRSGSSAVQPNREQGTEPRRTP